MTDEEILLDDFNALDYVLSNFLEVSRRFDSCLYDLKQYLKKRK